MSLVESGDPVSDLFSTHHTTEELCDGLLLIV